MCTWNYADRVESGILINYQTLLTGGILGDNAGAGEKKEGTFEDVDTPEACTFLNVLEVGRAYFV